MAHVLSITLGLTDYRMYITCCACGAAAPTSAVASGNHHGGCVCRKLQARHALAGWIPSRTVEPPPPFLRDLQLALVILDGLDRAVVVCKWMDMS